MRLIYNKLSAASWVLLILTCLLLWHSFYSAVGVVIPDARLPLVVLSFLSLAFTLWRMRQGKTIFRLVRLLIFSILLLAASYEQFARYSEKEVIFYNEGLKFYGTLYSPKFSEAASLVVVLHGSGIQPRGESAFYARSLARKGIAAFAYDKRGSGKSEGDTYSTDYYGYAADAVAAIDELRKTQLYKKTGLFEVSEGEWVGFIVDSITKIDFRVVISPSGDTPLNQVRRAMSMRLEKAGINATEVRRADSLYTKMLVFNNDSLERVVIEKEMEIAKKEEWYRIGKIPEKLYYYPWWTKVMNFDPQHFMRKSMTPILAFCGTENFTYPADESKQNYLTNSKSTDFRIVEKASHGMVIWKLGDKIPPPSFPDGYLQTYSDWIISMSR